MNFSKMRILWKPYNSCKEPRILLLFHTVLPTTTAINQYPLLYSLLYDNTCNNNNNNSINNNSDNNNNNNNNKKKKKKHINGK